MFTLEELRKMDIKKLLDELEISRKELFKAGFEVKTGTSKAIHLISQKRKYVAQIKTVMNSRKEELKDMKKAKAPEEKPAKKKAPAKKLTSKKKTNTPKK